MYSFCFCFTYICVDKKKISFNDVIGKEAYSKRFKKLFLISVFGKKKQKKQKTLGYFDKSKPKTKPLVSFIQCETKFKKLI